MKSKTVSKRPFTLLEVMIALMILTLIGAFSTLHMKKLLDNHRFESALSELYITLQEAQVLSANYQTDIALDITDKAGHVSYRFSTDEPFKTHQFHSKEVTLSNVIKLTFNGAKVKELHIDIYSGRIEPRGILGFYQSTAEEAKTLWFDLQYGHLMKFTHRKPLSLKQNLPARHKEKSSEPRVSKEV